MTPMPSQAFTFMTAFGLAMAVMGAVSAIQFELAAPEPISGKDLATAIAPTIQSLQALYPKMPITQELVLACCDAVAAVLNERRGQPAT